MGVVNVTPDSFSDGGQWVETDAAIAHGRELVAAGASIVDVGGESTRPGAERPSSQEELRRVVPVVAALAENGIVVSVDTMRAEVARAALEAGAAIINDVSGGLADPGMPALVAESGAPFVVMHWRGHSRDMQSRAHYDDVVEEVCAELMERVDVLLAAGATRGQLVLDPGIGFAKTAEHNWELLADLERVVDLGLPVLLGTSRKGFLGSVGRREGHERPLDSRAVVTAATSARAARAGVWCVRVHDVAATVDALDVVGALGEVRGGSGSGGFEARARGALAPPTRSVGPEPAGEVVGDRICLTGVRAKGFHGVLADEKRDGQEFVVDVVLHLDLAPAGTSDDLALTINYAEVGADVVARIEGPSLDLIESLAEQIAGDALARHGVHTVEVTVHKPSAPVGVPFEDVAVTLERRRSVPVVIALGANLGDAAARLDAALDDLAGDLDHVRRAPFVTTDPVGGPDQPRYTNSVVLATTALSPEALLARLHAVEARHGRVREVRWGARTLDLDLIQYGDPTSGSDVVSDDPRLTLPHPRAHERGFVLAPWARIDPTARLRVDGEAVDVADLLADIDTDDIVDAEAGRC